MIADHLKARAEQRVQLALVLRFNIREGPQADYPKVSKFQESKTTHLNSTVLKRVTISTTFEI